MDARVFHPRPLTRKIPPLNGYVNSAIAVWDLYATDDVRGPVVDLDAIERAFRTDIPSQFYDEDGELVEDDRFYAWITRETT